MKKILVLGAGRSASSLIKYLLDNSAALDWQVTIADISIEVAMQKTANNPRAAAVLFDVQDAAKVSELVKEHSLVISLLPATMHYSVAVECIKQKKHLVTASYVSKEMGALDREAKRNGVLLLNEIGLDPGIDHMSAMKIIDACKQEGEEIISFKSYCGGLIAPESNNNPWGYKFTWNPRNVVLAGQGTAKYIENGKYHYKPYSRVFKDIETISVEEHGTFDGYANRDSLSYRKVYGLETIPTMLRGTLRMPGFCEAWNVFVQLGLTDDSYSIENAENLTYAELIEALLPSHLKGNSVKEKLCNFLNIQPDSTVSKKIEWLDLFSDKKINIPNATPAMALQALLEGKWKLMPHDKDMIVLQHLFSVKKRDGKLKTITSSLVVLGEDQTYTAMAKTVGLPAAIAAKLILQGVIKATGVQIPTHKEIYEPVLKELEEFGVVFSEKEI
ncbi:MAG: saccharopine dehydrogenase NADP-binding domain-containing protein [Bacteroidetes bacterium]|nr:saccharopine dehydrogenase NADP-binding domain-containing protein [Bacteroidota bacterium]